MTGPAAEPVTSTRLTNALFYEHSTNNLEFLGGSQYSVRVERGGGDTKVEVFRAGTKDQMWSWLNGFRSGRLLPGPDGWWSTGGVEAANARRDRARADTAEFRRLLVDTSLADQMRIVILAGMEQQDLTFDELAGRIQRYPLTVRNALLLGRPAPTKRHDRGDVLELMLADLGKTVTRTMVVPAAPPAGDVDVVAAVSGKRDEPSGVARMRALLIAAERQLIDGVSPVGLQKARRASEFVIHVAGHSVTRPRDSLVHWLCGVADGAGDTVAMTALSEV